MSVTSTALVSRGPKGPRSLCLRVQSGCSAYNVGVTDISVKKLAEANFPTRWGLFRILGFEGYFPGTMVPEANHPAAGKPERRKESAVALVMGDIHSTPPLVRIHSQCLTGDVFGSLRCDCRQQLELALSAIAEATNGILIYEEQEGRGIGLMAKLQAYELQDSGLDTVQANEKLGFKADEREYNLPVQILRILGVKQVRLLSNNPDKVAALERGDIEVTERVPCEVEPTPYAEKYIETKREKMGHLFSTRFP